MIRVSFLLLICFTCSNSLAQREVDSLKKALQSPIQADSARVRTLLNLANVMLWQSPAEAMRCTEEALALAGNIRWQKGIALSLRQKGLVYYASSDLLNAMDYSLQALKAAEGWHSDIFNASIENNLANIYADLGEYGKALGHYNQYLAVSTRLHDEVNQMNALINIGNVYSDLNELSKGLDFFEQGMLLAEKQHNKLIAGIAADNIGVIYKRRKRYDSAVYFFRRCIHLADETGNTSARATALAGLSQVYSETGHYARAVTLADSSLQYARQAESPEWQRDAWQTLSLAFDKLHRPSKAFEAFKKYILFRDSILNGEKRQELLRKELQFNFSREQAAEKESAKRKIILREAEIGRQRYMKNITAFGAASLLLAAFVSFGFYKRKRDADVQRKEAVLRAQVLDTEVKLLRFQMNPHFIFNSLNSISDYISKHDLSTADDYLCKFASVIRYILENADKQEIALEQDLKALDRYMQVESLRLGRNFDYEINIDPSVDPQNTMVPPLMLQPFVENSIWHGLSKKDGRGHICISIRQDGEMLHCVIEDNGVGRSYAGAVLKKAGKTSMGMKITQARIDLLNKITDGHASVELQDLAQGLRVHVLLPLEQNIEV